MNAKPLKSQNERIEGRLLEFGYITRNQCLSTFPAITRLGARIKDLEARGWRFEAKAERGDYVYRVVSAPKRLESQTFVWLAGGPE